MDFVWNTFLNDHFAKLSVLKLLRKACDVLSLHLYIIILPIFQLFDISCS